VVEAITATELALQPADPAAASEEAPSTCAASAHQLELRRDDDLFNGFGFIANGLWQRTPANGTPAYSRSGPSSWFAWDPDPSLDGIASSQIISSSFVVPASQPSYVRFNHAYVFEWYDPVGGFPAYYPDGGQVLVQTLSGSTWTTRAVTWDNGPDKSLGETTTKVFGGDSHGYGSSRVNLTSLAGQTARVVFKVTGDQDTYFTGWWVDDVRLTTCPNAVASVPATTVAAATTSAKVSWTAPSYVGGSPVASYRITRSDGKVNTEPASARSIPLTGLKANTNVTVAVAAVTQDGHVGASSSVPVYATTAAVTSSRPRAVRNKSFTVTAKVVRRGTTTVVVAGVPLTLQRLLTGRKTWRKVSVGSTSAKGTRSWSVHQSVRTYYRVVTLGTKNWLGTTSAARTVAMR
jgi:acyl-coenzyme A thioesterase PaaI-like protein